MNLLEHYIKLVHNISEWQDDPNMIIVDVTYNCYGSISRGEHFTSKKQWEIDKERGYYLA